MLNEAQLASLAETVRNAKTMFVLLGRSARYDDVASALSLYLSLKEAGKNITIASPEDMRVEFSYLVGVDQIRKKIGNRNLVVSFKYEENSVEKVSYSISEDGKMFNLLIAPKPGGKPLDPADLNFSYAGAEGEIVFICGANSLEELGELYESEKKLFEDALTVSVGARGETPFAKMPLDLSGYSCVAEGTAVLLERMGYMPKDDIATNLLSSIEQATIRFQSLAVSPDTFETVAKLLRNGARRSASNPVLQSAQRGASAPASVTGQIFSAQPVPPSAFAGVLRGSKQQPLPEKTEKKEDKGTEPPEEWLQPKVFTGSSRA